MKPPTFYTVIIGKRSCTVSYAVGPAYEVQALIGTFASPDEASQHIKHSLDGKLEYLTPGAFQRKVGGLAYRYSLDLAKLQTWQAGARSKERSPRMALTNHQFISALPPNGLALAEEYLEQDLDLLEENDLPVSDTVMGLLLTKALREEEEEEQL